MHGTVHLFDRLPQVTRPAAPASGGVALVRQTPLIGVIRNPRSHRQPVAPLDWVGRGTLLVETPDQRDELKDVLARFAERRVDYILVAGGDGAISCATGSCIWVTRLRMQWRPLHVIRAIVRAASRLKPLHA